MSDGHGDGHGGGGGHDDEEHEEHEEHVNHEAWVIPYADLLTLLMAMFIALFAISNVDAQKFKKLAEGFSDALNAGGGASATVVDLGGSGDKIFAGPLDSAVQAAIVGAEDGAKAEIDPAGKEAAALTLAGAGDKFAEAMAQESSNLEAVKLAVDTSAAGIGGKLETRIDERGLVITVVTNDVVFPSGAAALQPQGTEILRQVGEALKNVDNTILVEGHTDSDPINSSQFPSNWALSGARAASVVDYLSGALQIPQNRFKAEGLADTRPVDPAADNLNDPTAKARNRRVEVIVQSNLDQTRKQLFEDVLAATETLQQPDGQN